MSDEREPPYYVDRAKTGRANCRGCRTPCLAGELRLAKIVIGPYGDNKPMKTWYHVDCMMNAFMKQRATTKRISSVRDIGNFSVLTSEDKEFLLKKINDMETQFGLKNKCQPNIIKDEIECDNDSSTNTVNIIAAKKNSSHRDDSFEEFYNLCKTIKSHDKYTDKTAIVKRFFSKGTDEKGFKSDISLWVKLLLPGVIKKVYNLKQKQLVKIFSRILHVDHDDMLSDLEKGNVGETIGNFYTKSPKSPASISTLTIFEVDDFLNKLSTMTKEDEQIFHFKSILSKCTAEDLKYIIYLINGDLKINAGCKHILNALHPDAYSMFQSSSNIDNVLSRVILNFQSSSSKQIISPKKIDAGLQIMVPISPMLAEAGKSLDMVMKKCPNGFLSEIKYDGERVQLHKSGSEFQYFSRSLKRVMDHKIAHLKQYIPKAFPHGNDLVLDSEVLMINTKTGDLLPFGSLGIHKKNQFQDANVCLFVFDCMYYNGESLIDKPLRVRREILKKNMVEIKNCIMFSEVQEIHKKSDLEKMVVKVFELGLEGLVLKDLESKYEPGKRHWLKLKKDYLLGGAMADSADLVVIGAWFGTGKRGGMLSTFLMCCYDEDKNQWLTVSKVAIGHDDETLASMQDSLRNSMTKISRNSDLVPSWLKCTKTMVPDYVAIDPKTQPVWEITGAEFSHADFHTANGISIRFPRVTKVRNDKCWKTATSLKELCSLYKNSKGKKDYSSLIKSGTSEDSENYKTNSKRKNGEEEPSSLMKSDTLECDENSRKKMKKKYCEEDSPTIIDDDVLQEALGLNRPRFLTPKVPLPDVFSGKTLFFCMNKKEENYCPRIKHYKRYWLAYGGRLDETEDGSEADYVIHQNSTIKYKEYKNLKFNISNFARHVTLDWLLQSIISKKLLNTTRFLVSLS